MSLSIAIVEDDRDYTAMLESLLSWEEGYAVAGRFESPALFLEAAKKQNRKGEKKWDLALIDLCLPGINGIETTRRLKEVLPDLPVVIFTVFEEPEAIIRALHPGAGKRLLKKTSAYELIRQLRALSEPTPTVQRPRARPRYLPSGFRPAVLGLCARVLRRGRTPSVPD